MAFSHAFIWYLTNKETSIVLCSVVNTQEAAIARKKRRGKHEQIGSNIRQLGSTLTENSNRMKKQIPQYSVLVCQKEKRRKEKERI